MKHKQTITALLAERRRLQAAIEAIDTAVTVLRGEKPKLRQRKQAGRVQDTVKEIISKIREESPTSEFTTAQILSVAKNWYSDEESRRVERGIYHALAILKADGIIKQLRPSVFI